VYHLEQGDVCKPLCQGEDLIGVGFSYLHWFRLGWGSRILGLKLWELPGGAQCYVLLKFICWNLNLPVEGVRRWSLLWGDEVIDIEPSCMGLVSLSKRTKWYLQLCEYTDGRHNVWENVYLLNTEFPGIFYFELRACVKILR
jgi:hypothetical protein